MNRPGTVLVVEDDVEMRNLLEDELREASYEVVGAANGIEALDRLSAAVDVVVTDHMMPGMKGRELLSEIRSREPEVPVVIITAFGDIESAVDAMRAGAFHYLAKPFRVEQLLAAVEGAMREGRLWQRLRSVAASREAGRIKIVGESPEMRRALDLTLKAAVADTVVVITGESGTGKELLARMLHAESPRRDGPFIPINCSAIPEALLESQLFGHRRGSFTDAREDHTGLFQQANGGTLFLDEIGDMPLPLQGKLLRVLQEKEVHPLGAAAPVPIDVRIVAATHQSLEALVEEGRFRGDLYYRLSVIVVRVPALRERADDVVSLAAHFLDKHGARLGRRGCVLTSEAMEALRCYFWPGNVRELENVIERALVLGNGSIIGFEDLPQLIRARHASVANASVSASLADVEREHILRTLQAVGGNRAAAARLLAVDRKTLYRKLKTYGIE